MKRYHIFLILLMLSPALRPLALTITAEFTGSAIWVDGVTTKINPNIPFDIKIYANPDDGVERYGWSSPFWIHGTNDVTTLTGVATYAVDSAFEAIWDMGAFDTTESWDGDLTNDECSGGLVGDQWNFSGISMAGWTPGGGPILAFTIRVPGVFISNPETGHDYGDFCISQGDFCINTYDWLFDPPVPVFNTQCLTVEYKTQQIMGEVVVYDPVSATDQCLPYFNFEIAGIVGSDTTFLGSGQTDDYAFYSVTIPYYNDTLFFTFNSDQPGRLFSLYDYSTGFPTPFEFVYNTGELGNSSPGINLLFDWALGDAYRIFRMIRDIYTTDSTVSDPPENNFDLSEIEVRVSDMYSTGEYVYAADPPYIKTNKYNWEYQIITHEIGHHIFGQLQGNWTGLPESQYWGSPSSLNAVTDSAHAFVEGWAAFIHAVSTVPDCIPFMGQYNIGNYEDNDWWSGTYGTNDAGEIVAGSVGSMLFDLFDDNDHPVLRAHDNTDEFVEPPSFTMPKIFYCISNYAETDKTWTFYTFAERLLHDETTPWYEDGYFEDLRGEICYVFNMHHYTESMQDDRYCEGANDINPDEQTPLNIPGIFFVNQNYPNPFNSSTEISFSAEKSGECNLDIYNILGQSVYSRQWHVSEPGLNNIIINESIIKNFSSGIYFYILSIGDKSDSKKMLLLK